MVLKMEKKVYRDYFIMMLCVPCSWATQRLGRYFGFCWWIYGVGHCGKQENTHQPGTVKTEIEMNGTYPEIVIQTF
jgi:hypothetical protein